MKKIVVVIVAVFVLLASPWVFAKGTTNLEDNNPIDKAFARDFEEAGTTVEINYVTEKYSEAWQAELKNVAEKIKKSYKYKEDAKRVDDYVNAYKSLAKKAFDLEMLNWSDTSQSPQERTFGTGGPGFSLMTESHIFKQATLNLINHYQSMGEDNKYKFAYKGKGAELQKIKQQNQ